MHLTNDEDITDVIHSIIHWQDLLCFFGPKGEILSLFLLEGPNYGPCRSRWGISIQGIKLERSPKSLISETEPSIIVFHVSFVWNFFQERSQNHLIFPETPEHRLKNDGCCTNSLLVQSRPYFVVESAPCNGQNRKTQLKSMKWV